MIENTDSLIEEENSDKPTVLYEPPKEKESTLARIISIALHPLFMVTYTVMLIFLYTDFGFIFANQFVRFMAPIVFLSCISPASGIYFLKSARIIQDYNLNDKKQWFLPFMVFFVCYGLLFYYFFSAKLYIWFLSVLIVPLVLLIIQTIISRFWKISIHMMAMGALMGSILSVCYNVKGLNPYVLFIILFILAGCLGVSRLVLNKNTPAQVYAGFIVGITISFLCVWLGAFWGFVLFMRNL